MAEQWMDDALCAEVGSEMFFPEQGGSTRDAKRICNSCAVRAQCLDYALRNGVHFGVWGGLSELERRKLNRVRKPPEHPHDNRVISLHSQGYSDGQIAEEMTISARQVNRIRERLGLPSNFKKVA